MPKKIDETADFPSDEMLERGKAFGAWFRAAESLSGKSIIQIAEEISVTKQQLYTYRKNCIASDGRFRKPSEGMIKRIASATGANVNDGLRAMGYEAGEQPSVPNALSELPPDAQQLLARFVKTIQPQQMTRTLSPEMQDLADYYEGLPQGPEKEKKREMLLRIREELEERYQTDTDTIGKLHPDESDMIRVPDDEEG